jgi:hypothetical protein
MKRTFATLVRTARTRLIMLAVLGGLAIAVAVHAQSNSTFHSIGSTTMVRGYIETTSSSSVLLMTIPGLGTVKVDCLNSLSRIAFFPSVSGSLWFTHGGAIGFAGGSNGTQLSNQATDDVITAQFATTTHTTTMVISGHPAATCIYSGQAIVQP